MKKEKHESLEAVTHKCIYKKERLLNYSTNEKNGITLIALVVTIIVLLILARSKYIYAKWTKWDIK